jgi:xylan 1,4-beta-xylosidase
MLHLLGEQRIRLDSDSALATKGADGSVVVALWNYAPPYGTGSTYTRPPTAGVAAKTFLVKLEGVAPNATVRMWRLDADHGNVMKTFDAMGRPAFPSREQIATLRAAGQAAPPQRSSLKSGRMSISVPAQGLVLIKIAGDRTAR